MISARQIWRSKGFWWVLGVIALICVAGAYGVWRSAHKDERPSARLPTISPKVNASGDGQHPIDVYKDDHPPVEFHSLPASPTPAPQPTQLADEKPLKSTSLILVSTAPTPVPTPTPPPKAEKATRWLPPGRFIQCILRNDLDSSHMDTPVEGIITENVYSRNDGIGALVIPAGSLVIAMANGGYVRDRVEVSGSWRIVFRESGRTVEFSGVACDREFDPALNEFGKGDKSSGIRGFLYESDHYVRLKGFVGLLLTTASNAAGQIGSSALQGSMGNNLNVSNVSPEAAQITNQYVQELLNGHHTSINDTLYVHVPSTKAFYVFNKSTIDLGDLERNGELKAAPKDDPRVNPLNIFDPRLTQTAFEYNNAQLKTAYDAQKPQQDPTPANPVK